MLLTIFSEVRRDVQRGQARLPAELAQVDVARGELVDEAEVAVLGGDVHGRVAVLVLVGGGRARIH